MERDRLKPLAIASCLFVVGLLVGGFGGELLDDDDEGGGRIGGLVFDEPYEVDIDPADFVTGVNNTYFPLTPGTTLVYEGDTEDGLERIEVAVTSDTRTVMGVECVVVHDTVRLGGELIEDTYDWYAQDVDGNVWYFGEDSKEYEDGKLEGTEGSWEAGVDGAMPGIVMFARPYVGVTYRQEYYRGEAEDMGTILALGEELVVRGVTYRDLLLTKDFTPLEPGVVELKYYAPGIGVVLEEAVKGGSERVELVEIVTG